MIYVLETEGSGIEIIAINCLVYINVVNMYSLLRLIVSLLQLVEAP